MSSAKRILTIRISGKERKRRVRKLLYDLAHFRNMLVILIRKYRLTYKKALLHESILYALLSPKEYRGKYKEEFEEALRNIENSKELRELLNSLRKQKEKINNPHFIQTLIKQVIKDFKGFFKALEKFREDPSKFSGMPRPPKPKKLRYLMNFSAEGNINTFKREGDSLLIRLRGKQHLKVRLSKDFPHKVSSVRLKFYGEDLYVDVVYEWEKTETQPKGEYRAGIDIGLDELLSVVSENPELRSFIVSGKEIKAFNQWFNKEKAKLQAQIDYLSNEIESGDYEATEKLKSKLREFELKQRVLSSHRKRWIEDNFHKIARKIVDILYETGHKVIYIGKNALESKRGINLGKRINQEFVSIPFRRLIELIKYKARELGMEVIEVDESYTSKTSPFADIKKVQELGKEKFKLIRKLEREKAKSEEEVDEEKVKALEDKIDRLREEIDKLSQGERRGNLFKDKIVDKVFHSDLVGALNILRVGAKLLKFSFYENSKALFVKLCNPVRLELVELIYQVSPEFLLGIGGSSATEGLRGRTGIPRRVNRFCA